jgi:two-component system phosphate regulon sensor histidine kinase PhoR
VPERSRAAVGAWAWAGGLGLAALAGAFAVRLSGWSVPGWLGGAAIGATLVAVVHLALHHRRTRRLLNWVGGESTARDSGVEEGALAELGTLFSQRVRKLERALAAERAERSGFLSAIEASPNGVLLLDAGLHIAWMNPTAALHFSLDRARDHRQRVTNLVRSPAFVALLQAGDPDSELTLARPLSPASLHVRVRRYGVGMRLVLSQDITERERHESMRREFVANVSHELRSPLTVLAGFVDTLLELPLDADERRRVLGLMRQQARRMQALVTDLLALARIEAAPPPAPDRWVDAEGLIDHLRNDALAASGGRQALSFERQGVARLAGAEAELFSACWNLLGNALRHTPPGGRVAVRLARLGDGSAEFSVADDGPGIAREHLPRLTERFYRVDTSRSRETGGTGLGLAIVKHVVQRHGGELRIESEPGRGSRFAFVLPAARVATDEGIAGEGPLAAERETAAATIAAS